MALISLKEGKDLIGRILLTNLHHLMIILLRLVFLILFLLYEHEFISI